MTQEFKSLGKKANAYEGLETFQAPSKLQSVTLSSDEVTAICPVTGQPDWYKVDVTYSPNEKCVESKTFKLFMHSLRETGMFCEALSQFILEEVLKYTEADSISVTVTQKPRGGVTITATSEYHV